jgi:hypothetical protein
VAEGDETSEPQMLSVSNVPASSVAPTDVPVRIAMDPLPLDRSKEGRKVVRALSHGDSLSPKSKSIAYLKAWVSGNARIAMDTTGPSLRLIAEEATFVRQGNGSVLVIRQRNVPPGSPPPGGDGLYVELWPVKW